MNFVYIGILKVLGALGFGFVTYQGFDVLINGFVLAIVSNWHGVGGDMMGLIDMAGFTDALGYSLSAITTKAALTATKRFMPK